MQTALSFDDVLIEPRFGIVNHREDVDLSTVVAGVPLKVPILSAAMSSVTESSMAIAMHDAGGAGVIHRFMSPEEQLKHIRRADEQGAYTTFAAIGVEEEYKRVQILYNAGCRNFCLDVAHAYSDKVMKFIEGLPTDLNLIVGNIATYSAVMALGGLPQVKAIKVGIGPGAACITRQVTGVGVPQLTAIMHATMAVKEAEMNVAIIADGGIKNSGDIVKAIVAGADAVMLGYLLAGAKEAPMPGEYYGMASAEAMEERGVQEYHAPEGVYSEITKDGSVQDIVGNLASGIKSGISYMGFKSLVEAKDNPKMFMRVTEASQLESGQRIRDFATEQA